MHVTVTREASYHSTGKPDTTAREASFHASGSDILTFFPLIINNCGLLLKVGIVQWFVGREEVVLWAAAVYVSLNTPVNTPVHVSVCGREVTESQSFQHLDDVH